MSRCGSLKADTPIPAVARCKNRSAICADDTGRHAVDALPGDVRILIVAARLDSENDDKLAVVSRFESHCLAVYTFFLVAPWADQRWITTVAEQLAADHAHRLVDLRSIPRLYVRRHQILLA